MTQDISLGAVKPSSTKWRLHKPGSLRCKSIGGFFIYVSMKVQKESPGLLHFKEKEHIIYRGIFISLCK